MSSGSDTGFRAGSQITGEGGRRSVSTGQGAGEQGAADAGHVDDDEADVQQLCEAVLHLMTDEEHMAASKVLVAVHVHRNSLAFDLAVILCLQRNYAHLDTPAIAALVSSMTTEANLEGPCKSALLLRN